MATREEEIKKIKKQLLKMKEEILQRLKNAKEDSTRTRDIGDEGDAASDAISRETSLALENRDLEILKEIEYALHKMEIGTYGICESCGDEIPIERLKVLPFARYCLECQEEIEKEQTKSRTKEIYNETLYQKDLNATEDIFGNEEEE
jgi:DnaK suppressor protein